MKNPYGSLSENIKTEFVLDGETLENPGHFFKENTELFLKNFPTEQQYAFAQNHFSDYARTHKLVIRNKDISLELI